MSGASTPAEHKRLVTFPEALHGLLCEPVPARAQIEKEMVDWVARFATGAGAGAGAGATH
jgi:hypothetical protein